MFTNQLTMKLTLATVTLLLATSIADPIPLESGQTLNCYGSDGWKNLASVKSEEESCFSRCYGATGNEMVLYIFFLLNYF